jgi:hypothetical protein
MVGRGSESCHGEQVKGGGSVCMCVCYLIIML